MDLTTIAGVKELMASSKSEQEWNDNCDKVKATNGAILNSGMQRLL